jgi:hypothetical protein
MLLWVAAIAIADPESTLPDHNCRGRMPLARFGAMPSRDSWEKPMRVAMAIMA